MSKEKDIKTVHQVDAVPVMADQDAKAIQEQAEADQKAADEAKAIQEQAEADVRLADEAKANQDKEDAEKKAVADAKAAAKNNVKVKFLLSPAGMFFLPWNVGDVVSMGKLQAQEIVDAKYAEFVK